jgi:hypothetical protein
VRQQICQFCWCGEPCQHAIVYSSCEMTIVPMPSSLFFFNLWPWSNPWRSDSGAASACIHE